MPLSFDPASGRLIVPVTQPITTFKSGTILVGDWQDGGDHYFFDVVHGLGVTGVPVSSFRDTSGTPVYVRSLVETDSNTLRISVSKDPDTREEVNYSVSI